MMSKGAAAFETAMKFCRKLDKMGISYIMKDDPKSGTFEWEFDGLNGRVYSDEYADFLCTDGMPWDKSEIHSLHFNTVTKLIYFGDFTES